MIVLHGTWKPPEKISGMGNFFIWGESSSSPLVKRGRKPKATQRLHPFQANDKELQLIMRSMNSTDGKSFIDRAQSDAVMLSLPSYSNAPQASPDLLRDDIGVDNEEKIMIIPWKINGLCIPPESALPLLNSFSGVWMDEGFATGADIRYWSKVSKFATELLSKQRFVPGVVLSENNESFARWQYVIDEQDERTRISMLKASMPPVCRAVQLSMIQSQDALLSDFLNSAIDSCIRSWIPIEEIKSKKPGLSEAWLRSLATGEPIRSQASIVKKVSEGIISWKAPIHEIEKSEFRTCFRLEPPFAEDGSWNLRYFLQASDDPSLLVPAANVWKESGDYLRFLNRKFDHPQEKLLADLGKASRLFSPVEDSLNSARPDAAGLTTKQAYSFLKEAAPLLTESGFGVLIPPWWNKGAANVRLGVKLNMKPKRDPRASKGIFGFGSIIQYDWQLSLGSEAISEEEFENLVNLKEPLVRIRGQWVEVKKEDIAAALKYFKSKQSGEMNLGEAIRLGAGLQDSDMGLPVTGFSAKGWLSDLFERLSGKEGVKELKQPADFVGRLRPYQVKGFSWLAFLRQYGLGACLADDMGLGKTIQFLALLLKDKKDDIEKPTLLICPTSVVGNWQREAAKFAPSLSVMVHHGMKRKKERDFLLDAARHDLVISTYALAHRDEEMLQDVEWNGIVLDEAQNIKNHFTKQSQAVRRLNSNYRVALTGTPVENRLSELWSIMEFLNPGYLGSSDGFRRNFALPIERYNNKDVSSRLRTIVSPFILRRLKTDPTIIKDLPEKIEIKDRCNLTKEQATLYEAIVKDMLRKIEDASGINRKGLVLSALMRLKQVCNHPAQFLGDGSSLPGRSGKLNRITYMMEEVLSEGDSALVFTQFAEMGGMLKRHFQKVFGQEVLFLHGGIPQKQRDAMVMRFSEKKGPRIFILSLKAGGVGLNLTRANHVFHFDRWWNPAVENQATDRAFRIGQTKNVQVHKFICEGTLEERIDEMIETKKALAENIIGTGEGWLTEMSTDQLRELFALRREAVADE
ncbi:MAG: DEAD/DEAH box helicase [Candidatus Methanoperedens sp.]|nr:DEAD/DEAH box helicase [Candidatus Methanoperedens sp.]